ncbi:hypothetical protein BE21_00795 [Sorangium cellulosum]|uniref:Uncharacterized protein n=1 Tax=Sorangium cellulosum TaxID=56 RepID=A0A150U3I9_SORCE|nr:hypothetical protein BE21_00795 [Sorangium cellulosum]
MTTQPSTNGPIDFAILTAIEVELLVRRCLERKRRGEKPVHRMLPESKKDTREWCEGRMWIGLLHPHAQVGPFASSAAIHAATEPFFRASRTRCRNRTRGSKEPGLGRAGGPRPIRLCLPLLSMSPAQGSLEAHALREAERAVAIWR